MRLDEQIGLTPRRIFGVRPFVERHDFLTEGGVRHLIFNADRNGFNEVIVRMGRRVLIDEQKFFEWLDRQSK